jgi:cytochrome c peroxidase
VRLSWPAVALPLALALALALASCQAAPAPWQWQLPEGFPVPLVPADNPMTTAKVALGRALFYSTQVSGSGTMACASCHVQSLGFSNGQARGQGLHHATQHSVVALSVPAYPSNYLWADSRVTTLEEVVLDTLQDDNELGPGGQEAALAARLGSGQLGALLEEAFPGQPATYLECAQALAAFVRTIASGNSPYDRYNRGAGTDFSASAERGMNLFFSERLECYHCHGGFTLTDSVTYAGLQFPVSAYDNTGLYNVDGQGAYPADDPGLVAVTGLARDRGRFKAPSLRNVAVTAPYMHDGSLATLGEVVDAYLAGGRAAVDGGVPNPLRSGFVRPIELSADERADLLAFLDSLTDEAFLHDARYSNPLP